MRNLRPYLTALWLVARVALAAPDAGDQPASTPKPVALANPAPRAKAIKTFTMPQNSASLGPVQAGPAITLYHGEVQVLDMRDVSRIAVGNGGVLRATVAEPAQIVLIGEGAGNTTLRVWTVDGAQYTYDVTVRLDDTARILRDVQDLLASERDLTVRQMDGHVLIEGDYSDPRTTARLLAIQKIYPQAVIIVPPHKLPTVVPVDRMVHMDVRVVEIRKSALERLGINWAAQAQGPALGGSIFATKNIAHVPNTGSFTPASGVLGNAGYFGIASNLTSMLDLLGQSGDSWTLAEPNVSCKSGGEAKFIVGGEIPIPVANGLGTTSVVYKKYGIILEFKPVADEKGNITSSIVAEVSEPDTSFSNANGMIAFRQNRTETEVSLKENETLVISGLLRNSGSKAFNGIPGLMDVPVLGALFRSKEFQNERTELVVLVTPRSVDAQSSISTAAVQRADEYTTNVNRLISAGMAE